MESCLKTGVAIVCAGILSGCGMIGGAVDDKINSGCSWTTFIMVSKDDKLTDGTADQILAHNITRQRICE